MPKLELHNLKDTTHPQSKQIQFLENKINRLHWLNDDLNKQVFNAVQRGHRLAAKLGYEDLNAAEAALATQTSGDASQAHQNQLEQLSQHSSEQLASHVQALQAELVSHVQLSKATLGALEDALAELSAFREENEKLRGEATKARTERKGEEGEEKAVDLPEVPSFSSDSTELAFVKAEFAALQDKYAALRKAKKDSDDKHAKDYRQWKEFKQWLCNEELKKAERKSKRRKLNPSGEDDEDNGGALSKLEDQPRGKAYERARKMLASSSAALARMPPLGESSSPPTRPSVLVSRNLNSGSSSPPSDIATPSKPGDVPFEPLQNARRNSSVVIPNAGMPGSSDTESDSQPVTFIYPSQLNEIELPSTVPQKRPRPPAQEGDSSETEAESQAVSFLFPSQMVPLTPAQVSGIAFDDRRAQPPLTPVSVVRPHASKPRRRPSPPTGMLPPPSSPSSRDRSRPSLRSVSDSRPRVPETPVSRQTRKGKERATGNDENAPASTTTATSPKALGDYSIYKGRGRYGPQAQAATETINTLFEIDPGRNGGVDFQFEEVVRNKEKRKGMHGGDCECCRDYYNAVGRLGPLPTRLKPPMWRSPESSPSKKPVRISFGDDIDDENENTAIKQQHKNTISRHREEWERAKTPPGYWNIGFPDTQEVAAMNAEAARMHARKRAMVAEEAERGGKYRKRNA